MLADMKIQVIPQSEFAVSDAEETGTTFVENAIIKARHAARITGLPAVADDSGLEVDLLHGRPGVYPPALPVKVPATRTTSTSCWAS